MITAPGDCYHADYIICYYFISWYNHLNQGTYPFETRLRSVYYIDSDPHLSALASAAGWHFISTITGF